jgi:hypothetical protein
MQSNNSKTYHKPAPPYKPVPFRDSNTNVELYDEPFEDRIGNKATITKANYTDKKGKKVMGYTLFIKWL